MTTQRITVYGQDVLCELSTSVPISEQQSFIKDLIEDVQDAIAEEMYEGICEMYYTEGGNDTDEDGIEIDVDVKWKVIDWKQIATDLYNELKRYSIQIVVDDHPAKKVCKQYEQLTS